MNARPTTATVPEWSRLDEPGRTSDILASLARLHDLVVVCDRDDRIAWMSDRIGVLEDPLVHIGDRLGDVVGAGHGLDALREQVASPLGVGAARLEVAGAGDGGVELDVSAFRMNHEPDLTVLVARTSAEAKRCAATLRGSADYLAAILDSAPDAVVATDRGGFVSYANPAAAALFRADVRALEGRPLASCLPCSPGLAALLDGVREGTINGHDLELRQGDERRWISVSVNELRLPSGEIAGNVVFVRDVSERRRAELALAAKAEELEHYVTHVSHDLRSPLSSLLGFARLLRDDHAASLSDRGRDFLRRIEEAGLTMETLITELLELSRIGRPGEEDDLVDPIPVLEQIVAEWKPRFEDRHIAVELPTEAPLLLCNRMRVYQLFSNLLGNAIAHMGPRPDARVRVEIGEDADAHHIRVSDNGKGIAREHHQRIFEVFATLGRPSDGAKSTGIGLAIVRKIAATHGGRAWVESATDCGSTFHITLARPRD